MNLFYSAHFFLRKAGIIKDLALGDFTVSMGQGLILWQGMATGKGSAHASTLDNWKRCASGQRRDHLASGAHPTNSGVTTVPSTARSKGMTPQTLDPAAYARQSNNQSRVSGPA